MALHGNKEQLCVFIPELYANCRPIATEEILNAIEEGLLIIPGNLVGLIRSVQLHLGKNVTIFGRRNVNSFDDTSFTGYDRTINIYHRTFTGPAQSLDAHEKFLIDRLKPGRTKLALGQERILGNALSHEVGHLLAEYILENFQGAEIRLGNRDKVILCEDTFNLDILKGSKGWNDLNNIWVQIVNADGSIVSSYGNQSSPEDFAESVNGWIKDQDTFRRFFPNRCAFLDYFIPLVKTEN